MTATGVTAAFRLALRAAGLNLAGVERLPRLLSDKGPSYQSAQLVARLEERGMRRTSGQPDHPMSQGKIERNDRSLRNRILLEHYDLL